MKTLLKKLLTVIVALVLTSNLMAQPILDPHFGTNGTVTTAIFNDPVSGAEGYANATKVQSDGKIVIAGSSIDNTTGNTTFVLARFNTDGTLDNTFGSNGGTVRTTIGSLICNATALAIQSDGKIIAVGTALNPTTENGVFALARYKTDGTLDTSFGTNGIVTTENVIGADGIADNNSYSIALQSDGKIVVAGYSYLPNDTYGYALARYNTDGTLDTSFGTNGSVTDQSGVSSVAWSVCIQSDNKIIIGGDMNDKSMVARFNTNGTLDNSFGMAGFVTTTVFVGEDYTTYKRVAIQPDGKIVAAALVTYPMHAKFAVVRYNTDGSLDSSNFGLDNTGINAFNISGGEGIDQPFDMCLQADGKIIVVGETEKDGKYKFAIARLNTDGKLDSKFGTNGSTVVYNAGGINVEMGYGVTMQSDGKIVVAGYTTALNGKQPTLTRLIDENRSIYVNAAATGNNSGTSWTNAYTSLQSGLNDAVFGYQIWVAKGTYKPSSAYDLTNTSRFYHFRLKEGIKVYGGFAGTETEIEQRVTFSKGETNETILSGDIGTIGDYSDNCYHVIYNSASLNLTQATVLDGFTVKDGNADGTNPHNIGGGILTYQSSPEISRVTFVSNKAGSGAGLYIYSASPIVNSCLFYNNSATSNGGGIAVSMNCNPVLNNNTIVSNTAANGGGFMSYNSQAVLNNCIVWSNTASTGKQFYLSATSTATLNYSDYSNSANDVFTSSSTFTATNNNFSSNPLFVNASVGDFRLFGNSPAVNTGNNSYNTLSTDFRGQARIQNTTIDMGAYEWTSGVEPNNPTTDLVNTNSNSGVNVYPNPSNGLVNFHFTPENGDKTTIDIFSITGELVHRVFEGTVEQGTQQIIQFTKPIPEGLYIYKLTNGSEVKTGRLIRMRGNN